MKKLCVLLLVLALMLSLAACSSLNSALGSLLGSSTGSTQAAEISEEVSQPEDVEAEETEPVAETVKEKPISNQVDFEEQTILDNEECSITITSIDPDNIWGYTLTAHFENKSAENTYLFSIDDAYINGVENDPYFAIEVTPGKNANCDITFPSLESYGISDFTDIEMHFIVFDSDNWDADYVADETVHIYPNGEENATTFTREAQDTDVVLVDNEYVTATIIDAGYDPDYPAEYGVTVFLQNHTDTEIMFSIDGVSVNGTMNDPYWAASIAAGNAGFSTISWYDLESDGITDVSEIEFTFSAYDYDSWDDYADELIVFNP